MNNQEFNVSEILQFIKKHYMSIIIVIALLIVGFGSFFQVGTEEEGVVTRLGKHVRTVTPGLKMKIPFAEKVYKVPVERQKKQEFGFRTQQAGVRTEYSRTGSVTEDEAIMLTGDLNLANVQWVVQYRVNDPYNYLFKVRNPDNTLRDLSEAITRQIVGDRTVNEVLTVGRAEIASEVKVLLQEISKEYSLGIEIAQVVLQDINPPESVKQAFNAVNEAQQERETLINEAKSEYNKVIPRARGQAEETIQKAEGYATQRVNNAQGEVARFNALYEEYVQAPEVTKRRIYLETLQDVLPKLGDKIITSEKGNNMIPLLKKELN
ncbi:MULTISPECIES: FtsH protease activity modulator HflK [Maribellus]|uniref:Protein HflK n=1 Tax=Maribellus comscasis TaxID=2681766 RepID=A0A6I6JY59_9BACT|nr:MULTISPECIES: FtsH protease activity modulator HflK [Maribellus]MCG6191302.1 FtsH protease activity modulator HflK [Maribellus maritimus]QGY46088.1 FtsH protease activity modulator HflK [Maribellus comscasis]